MCWFHLFKCVSSVVNRCSHICARVATPHPPPQGKGPPPPPCGLGGLGWGDRWVCAWHSCIPYHEDYTKPGSYSDARQLLAEDMTVLCTRVNSVCAGAGFPAQNDRPYPWGGRGGACTLDPDTYMIYVRGTHWKVRGVSSVPFGSAHGNQFNNEMQNTHAFQYMVSNSMCTYFGGMCVYRTDNPKRI